MGEEVAALFCRKKVKKRRVFFFAEEGRGEVAVLSEMGSFFLYFLSIGCPILYQLQTSYPSLGRGKRPEC